MGCGFFVDLGDRTLKKNGSTQMVRSRAEYFLYNGCDRHRKREAKYKLGAQKWRSQQAVSD
jgi:hypothetical protein